MTAGAAPDAATSFALIDCNNFFASCETIFRPDLRGQPLAVMSSNDGCIIARSHWVKKLGVGMGVPLFKVRRQLERHNAVLLSSNFELYGDISARVMQVIAETVPRIEPYSIDECFVNLSGLSLAQQERVGWLIKRRVRQWVGIDVCVGIGASRTLAKLAAAVAKNEWKRIYDGQLAVDKGGVVSLHNEAKRLDALAGIPLSDVWGVGQRTASKLGHLGINTPLLLTQADSQAVRKKFSVGLQRVQLELQGQSCLSVDETPQPRKQLMHSRTFSGQVTEWQQMREAVCSFTARVAEKLRAEGSCAGAITIYLHLARGGRPVSSSHKRAAQAPKGLMPIDSATTTFAVPLNDSRPLLKAAVALAAQLWRQGYSYRKAGVLLGDLVSASSVSNDLFAHHPKATVLMRAVDAVNRYGSMSAGRGTGSGAKVQFASEGLDAQWRPLRQSKSPSYTTSWQELPTAH